MSYDFQERSVAEVVSGAVEANLGFGAEHGVQLRFEAPDGDAPVSVDPDRVLQVVANLVSNAVKFSPEGGTVHVSVAPRGDVVRVSIRDEGPGIPEDYREQIFEKFSQAGKSQTGRQRGTGLGLSIARAIVEDHQGTIGFDTETGQGTTFWFELPKVGETAG